MKNIFLKLNFYSVFIFAITITAISCNCHCIISVSAEASSGDSISRQVQVTSTPYGPLSDSLKEIPEHKPGGKPEQASPIKKDVSASQTQATQPERVEHPLDENRLYEGSKLLSRGECLTLAGIIIAFLSGWYFARLKDRIRIKSDVNRKLNKFFDKLPWRITPEEKKVRENHRDNFYAGNAYPDPSVYIGLDLDAERIHCAELIRWIKEKKAEDWFHISIYGDRKQGKTMFMARLAYNLSRQKKTLKMFGRRYHVLWCKKADDKLFRHNLNELRILLAEYRKHIFPRKSLVFRRKPLIVFIDDIFRPDILECSEIVELDSIKRFLRELMHLRINIISSSSSQDIAIEETKETGVLLKLKLERADADYILSKLVSEDFIPKEFADKFPKSPKGESFYKKQLFAFFNSLLSEFGIGNTGFIKDFEKHFDGLSSNEKLVLKLIAVCQLVDVFLPEAILQESFPKSFPRLQSGLGGLVRKEEEPPGSKIFIYHMGGPFLAKWLLNEKFNIRDFDALISAYSELFDHILSVKLSFARTQETTIIRLILKRLIDGWHYSIFNFLGRPLAKALFESSKTLLEPYLNGLTDTATLVVWAAMMNNLGEKEMARTLYLKAGKQIQIPEEAPTMESMRTPVSLAMGLADMSERSTKELAIPLFQKIIDKLVVAKSEPWMIRKVVHKLVETLGELGQDTKALETIENLASEVPLDALLWQKKGDILRSLGRLSEAKDCFKQSIESARFNVLQNPQTLLQCLQHYADFLSHNRKLARKSGEDPEVYLQEAEQLFKDKKVEGYETVLNVWAKHKRNEGDISKAKKLYEECITYCKQEGIIHPHSWNDFARLLITHGSEFNEKSYEKWLGEAENYCWEVINNTGTDRTSRRVSYHIVGMLVGTKTYTSLEGKQRPDFSEAVSILQSAFESPAPERNDDEKKSFQDVITHRALKDIYVRWSDSEELSPGNGEELIKKADFHFQKAFSGLPRPDMNSSEEIEHALETQVAYAFFKWKRRDDLAAADLHYREVIKKREDLNYDWPAAYTLYEYYAMFIFDQKKEEYEEIAGLHRKALEHIPESKVKEKAMIQAKLGQCLSYGYHQHLKSKSFEEAETKLDEAITAFEAALKQTPFDDTQEEFPEDWACAKALANILFAPKMGIIKELCTSDRVNRLKDMLLRAWESCPDNIEALDGLFTIGDTFISKYFQDKKTLDDLKELISSKAIADNKIAAILHSVCRRRRTNQYRGELTNMLCGA